MSSGDFAAELRQSVADSIALVHNAAKAAKARIGQAVPSAQAAPMPAGDVPPPAPRPAVNFFADEPVFDEGPASAEDDSFASALAGSPEPLPNGSISFDDNFTMQGVDDEGIPVWEDPP